MILGRGGLVARYQIRSVPFSTKHPIVTKGSRLGVPNGVLMWGFEACPS